MRQGGPRCHRASPDFRYLNATNAPRGRVRLGRRQPQAPSVPRHSAFGGRIMQPEALQVSAAHALEIGVALASAPPCWDGWARYPSARSASARTILADLKPRILAAAQASGDAGEMIGGFDSLVRQLSVGTHLFASLAAEPVALACLLALVTRAPRLAARLADQPDL